MLEIESFTLHDLRRTLATWLGENHVAGGIRKVYNTARYNAPAREWWKRWGQHVEELM